MAWTVQGSVKGPKGDTGSQGPQGTQGPQGAKGDTGTQGPQGVIGPAGPQGATGQDGAGIEIAGSVATYANLPTGLTAANSGDGYLVNSDGKLYIWSGTAFPPNGSGVAFQGPAGPAGGQGPQGVQGTQGVKGDTGDAGAAGATGPTGPTGTRGSQWYTGSGTPSGISEALIGDMYLDILTGDVYKLS